MNWSKIGDTLLGAGLPLLGGLVGGPAGAGVGHMIASALGVSTPDEADALIRSDPKAVAKLRELEANNRHELERLNLEATIASVKEANATMRVEVASNDGFVRRARPLMIYIVAYAVFMQVNLAIYVAAAAPAHIGDLASLFNAVAIPLSAALAVCGIYFKKRSDEKMAGVGAAPGTMLSSIRNLFGGAR